MQTSKQKYQITILAILIASIIVAATLLIILLNRTPKIPKDGIAITYQGNTFNAAADTLREYMQIMKDQPYALYEYSGSKFAENYQEKEITDINEFLNRDVDYSDNYVYIRVGVFSNNKSDKERLFSIIGYYEPGYAKIIAQPQKYGDMPAYFEVVLGSNETFSIDGFEIASQKTTRKEFEEYFANYESLPNAEPDHYYVFRYKNHIVAGLFITNGINTLSIYRGDYMDPYLDNYK